jgi:hypothetical protein
MQPNTIITVNSPDTYRPLLEETTPTPTHTPTPTPTLTPILAEQTKRHCSDILILTTFPHYVPLAFILPLSGFDTNKQLMYLAYSVIIALSTTASVVWHLHRERKGLLLYLDYSLALMTTSMELVLSTEGQQPIFAFTTIVVLNFMVYMLNLITDYIAIKQLMSYRLAHSGWHCFSAFKCIYAAAIITSNY